MLNRIFKLLFFSQLTVHNLLLPFINHFYRSSLIFSAHILILTVHHNLSRGSHLYTTFEV